jgi:hypothetical protein
MTKNQPAVFLQRLIELSTTKRGSTPRAVPQKLYPMN